jgi:DNA processing protein
MSAFFEGDPPPYPQALREVLDAQRVSLTLSRPLTRPNSSSQSILQGPKVIAVIGARKATKEAGEFAKELGRVIAGSGRIVVSGGAFGIDKAAHEGALEVSGTTWCVAATGPDGASPSEHEALFKQIEQSPGAMIWTQPPGTRLVSWHFVARNSVLVSLSDLVIVVQAGASSGSLITAQKAQKVGCPVRVVQPAAWSEGFDGSRSLLRGGKAKALESMDELRLMLGLPPLVRGTEDPGSTDPKDPKLSKAQLALDLSEPQVHLLEKVTQSPQHVDEIAHSAGVRPRRAATLLLTLALENVVVEGPSGFFRRQQLL